MTTTINHPRSEKTAEDISTPSNKFQSSRLVLFYSSQCISLRLSRRRCDHALPNVAGSSTRQRPIDLDESRRDDEEQIVKIDQQGQLSLLESVRKDFSFVQRRFSFVSFRTVESDLDAANRLETQWKSFQTVFSRVEKFSSDLTLSKPSSTGQWSGVVTVASDNDRELTKVAAVINQEYLTRSSLIKSGTIQSNRIYFLNYGRVEDLSDLMEKNLIDWSEEQPKVALMRRRSTLISTTEQIRQAIRYQFSALVLFDDDEQSSEENPLDSKSRLTLAQEGKRLKSKKGSSR